MEPDTICRILRIHELLIILLASRSMGKHSVSARNWSTKRLAARAQYRKACVEYCTTYSDPRTNKLYIPRREKPSEYRYHRSWDGTRCMVMRYATKHTGTLGIPDTWASYNIPLTSGSDGVYRGRALVQASPRRRKL